MYNFYQSFIRKTINKDIYKKPVGEVTLFGHTYQYIIREKKKFTISINRIQILGIEDFQGHTYDQRKTELSALTKQHNPLFIQLGSIDVITVLNRDQLHDTEILADAKKARETIQNSIVKGGFIFAKKENLPPSTYYIDNTLPEELLRKAVSASHKVRIKKARKNNVIIRQAIESEYDTFYTLLKTTGQKKGFGVIGYKRYKNLMEWGKKNDTCRIYIATLDDVIVGGAIYSIDKPQGTAIYLYGATDRTHANLGASHLLHRETWRLLKDDNIHTIDLLGGAPTGSVNHHLESVGAFKQGFGSTKYDVVGSYDIVYRPTLYYIRRSLRK